MVNVVLKRSESGRISILIFLLIVMNMINCGGDGGSDDTFQDQNIYFEPSFGIHPSSLDEYAYAKDLGMDFNREGVYFIWNWVDTDRNGIFSFKHATVPPAGANSKGYINYDDERLRLLNVEGITLMNNVSPFNSRDQLENEFQNEEEKAIYKTFVEKLAERYDGDSDLGCTMTNGIDCYNLGDNEFPSQELISALQKNPIKYWQVCNQVTDTCDGVECMLNEQYAQKYVEVMELTYTAIKSSCPDCQVLIAGDSSINLYPPVYKRLAGNYIDIVDKHFFGEIGEYTDISEEMDFLKDSLSSAGFDLDQLRFWITEIGTHSGDPVDDRAIDEALKEDPPYQTEKEQSQDLIKRYVVSFGYGIEKVLWAWGIKEGFGCDCCQFDYTGLIYDGNSEPQTCDESDIHDRGDGVKKLAYFSYKMMTQKLKEFISVNTIIDSNGTYVYRFAKDEGGPVYVCWSESGESVTLTEIESNSIEMTMAVPGFECGNQVTDFNSAFVTDIKTVSNGNIRISLDENPVYVEEYESSRKSF